MSLLLGVEIPVNLRRRRVGRLLGQRRESAGAHIFDPAQVGHERLQFGTEFGPDGIGTGCVPIDIGERPLAILDLGEHSFHVDGHRELLFVGTAVVSAWLPGIPGQPRGCTPAGLNV